MISSKIKLDDIFEGKMDNVRKNTADAIISIVLEEFNTMLRNSPQRYGNFTANFTISPGLRVGRKSAEMVFPTDVPEAQWFKRGQLPAINHALSSVAGLSSKMTTHITRSSGWMTGMTVYNRLDYAEKVEGYSEFTLRAENKGAAHPLSKMQARLKSRSKKKIVYGSPEFLRLLSGGV